jgi:hypothetical protein
MSSNDEFAFSIDLTVRNEWKNIDLLRTSVQNCFTAVFSDLDGCHAIAMVTGELLENALKYGNWTKADRTMFRLRVTGSGGNIEIAVQNPLKEDDQHAASLKKAIDWINSFPKPRAPSADRAGRRRGIAEPARARAHRVRGQLSPRRVDRQGHRHRDGDARPEFLANHT